jgi:hypothetical protein
MSPIDCPPCYVVDRVEVPQEARPYCQSRSGGGWILRDILDHLMSVNTPVRLRPVYEIRQYSHRRASVLKRNLVPHDSCLDCRFIPKGWRTAEMTRTPCIPIFCTILRVSFTLSAVLAAKIAARALTLQPPAAIARPGANDHRSPRSVARASEYEIIMDAFRHGRTSHG